MGSFRMRQWLQEGRVKDVRGGGGRGHPGTSVVLGGGIKKKLNEGCRCCVIGSVSVG